MKVREIVGDCLLTSVCVEIVEISSLMGEKKVRRRYRPKGKVKDLVDVKESEN